MSLGRLLATGKSLVGGQNSTGRYHLNKQMGLPKFISPRNPFAIEVKVAAVPSGPVATEQKPTEPTATAIRAVSGESSKRAAFVVWLGLVIRSCGEWLGKANPFSRFPKSVRPKRTAMPRCTKPPVQSELCLDNVHVVRNDLSDADLEVVPVAPAGVKPDSATADQCETTGRSWGRLTTRMFGSNHT